MCKTHENGRLVCQRSFVESEVRMTPRDTRKFGKRGVDKNGGHQVCKLTKTQQCKRYYSYQCYPQLLQQDRFNGCVYRRNPYNIRLSPLPMAEIALQPSEPFTSSNHIQQTCHRNERYSSAPPQQKTVQNKPQIIRCWIFLIIMLSSNGTVVRVLMYL